MTEIIEIRRRKDIKKLCGKHLYFLRKKIWKSKDSPNTIYGPAFFDAEIVIMGKDEYAETAIYYQYDSLNKNVKYKVAFDGLKKFYFSIDESILIVINKF